MDGDIGDTLAALTAMREEARRDVPDDLGPEWRRGSGLALGVSDPGASPVSSAIVRLLSDGSVSVSVGSSELGQGVRTVIAQIVAETMHVDFSVVRVVPTDTGSGPYDASTGASRSTTMSGLAAHRAALSIVDRVLHCTAERESVPVEELRIRDGAVVLPDGRTVPMGLVFQQVFGQRGGNLIGVGEVVQQEFPTTPAFWEISAGTAEVAVDTGTGEVRILGYGTSSDVGRAVNPITMEGQEEGAFAQGLGHALFEEMRWDAGQPVTDSLVNYRVPRAADMPRWFKSVQIENADGPGAFGIKGGGEGPIVPAAGAIGNALRDACGVQITELPLHAERVWRALVDAGVARNHFSATERTT
jgi:CO/xanthine dehydrogenase Mo-binding subunit